MAACTDRVWTRLSIFVCVILVGRGGGNADTSSGSAPTPTPSGRASRPFSPAIARANPNCRRYLDGRTMSLGFEKNAQYFKLDFLDPADFGCGERYEAKPGHSKLLTKHKSILGSSTLFGLI